MKKLFEAIIQTPTLYARFLNTLSLLEYIGARKILKSQRQETLSEKVLAHVAEEIRHAQVLKRAATKIAPELCQTYAEPSLLAGKEAVNYIQTVDHAAEKTFGEKDVWNAYLYTTLLVELRATTFYAAFESVLQENGASIFRGILQEEERHLEDIEHWLQKIPDHAQKIQTLKDIEQAAFLQWVKTVEQAVRVEHAETTAV